jgi:pimeloyl-ACP methyl ester carboxylesterase
LAVAQSEKIPVYFMPGMAASPGIFKNINLPELNFESYWLEWFVPEKGMTLQEYAAILCREVRAPDPVLIGVSFGGILVQEMAKLLQCRKVIIISSVKCIAELPGRLLFARYTGIHKLLPTSLVNNVEMLTKFAFGETVGKRLELYEEYLGLRDTSYIDWAIDQMVNWKQETYETGLVHIHGEKDAVFPIQHINDCIPVKNGTHTMIIHRYKWFNERLPAIILEERSSI